MRGRYIRQSFRDRAARTADDGSQAEQRLLAERVLVYVRCNFLSPSAMSVNGASLSSRISAIEAQRRAVALLLDVESARTGEYPRRPHSPRVSDPSFGGIEASRLLLW